MKRDFFIGFILCCISSLLSAKELSLFNDVQLPYYVYFCTSDGTVVANFEYNEENKYFVGYEGSGFAVITSDVYEENNVLNVDFVKIWNGAEEISKTDRRKIYKYHVTLSKQDILEGKDVTGVEPIFSAADTRNGVPGVNTTLFYVNSKVNAKSKPSDRADDVMVLDQGDIFELKDVIRASNMEWIKISRKHIDCYIPFSTLGTAWVIKKSELPNIPVKAYCNDSRVRVRTEPNLKCDTITYLNPNDSLFIISRSDKKFEIIGERFYWYMIQLPDKSTGWVYGKYLDIE